MELMRVLQGAFGSGGSRASLRRAHQRRWDVGEKGMQSRRVPITPYLATTIKRYSRAIVDQAACRGCSSTSVEGRTRDSASAR